jgi:hypothetical protein
MRFCDVDNQKGNAVSILLIELVEGGNLPPERRSSIAAKYKHHRPLLVQCGKLNRSALVLRYKREIRGGISYAQSPRAGMSPKRFKREEQENDWSGYSGHDAPKLFRRLAHGPPDESTEGEIDRSKTDKKSEQQPNDERTQYWPEIQHVFCSFKSACNRCLAAVCKLDITIGKDGERYPVSGTELAQVSSVY